MDSATANDAPDQQAGPASQVVAEFSASYLVLCPITCFLLPFQAEDAKGADAEVGRWNAARQSNMCLVNFATAGTMVSGNRGRGRGKGKRSSKDRGKMERTIHVSYLMLLHVSPCSRRKPLMPMRKRMRKLNQSLWLKHSLKHKQTRERPRQQRQRQRRKQ